MDLIAKVKSGRAFPLTKNEIVHLVEAQNFCVHSYNKRLPLRLENCDFECEKGFQIASFNRMGYLAIFSLPLFPCQKTATLALKHAIEEFGQIDKQPYLNVREQQVVMYRAYLKSPSVLAITQHIVNTGSRSYLMYKKLSQITKGKSRGLNEYVLTKIKLT